MPSTFRDAVEKWHLCERQDVIYVILSSREVGDIWPVDMARPWISIVTIWLSNWSRIRVLRRFGSGIFCIFAFILAGWIARVTRGFVTHASTILAGRIETVTQSALLCWSHCVRRVTSQQWLKAHLARERCSLLIIIIIIDIIVIIIILKGFIQEIHLYK